MLCTVFMYSQDKKAPTVEKQGDITEVTYYYDSGEVEQHGFFNKDGKVHGVWTSYDLGGNKVAVGSYDNGKKVGKWFFWTDDTLKEVDFRDSRITSVSEWKSESKVAIRD